MAKEHYWVRFFLSFDYFGINLAFRKSEDEDSFTSVIGGVIFIIVFSLSMYYCTLNFIPFITRNSYTSMTNVKSIVPNSKINFTEVGINIGYNLIYEGNNTVISDDVAKYFTITSKLVKVVNATYRDTTVLPTTKCTPALMFNKPEFNQVNGDSFQCLDHKSLSIEGSYTSNPFTYIDVTVALDKTTANTNAQVYLDLFRKNSILFNMIYMESTLDLDDFDKPVNTYISSFLAYIDYWTIRKINFFFSSFYFENDDDLFVEDYSSVKSFNQNNEFYEYSTYLNDRSLNPNQYNLLKIYIRSSPNVVYISRQYQKLGTYLADMSGLISNILLIIYVITNYINTFIAEQSIMNRMLCYKDFIQVKNSERQIDLINTIRNRNRDDQLGNNNDESNISRTNNNAHNTLNPVMQNFNIEKDDNQLFELKPIDVLKNSRKPVDFNCFEILFRTCACSKKLKVKSEIYERSLSKLYYYLSIFTYIKAIQSIDILKHVILDKEQLNIFNFISRPNVGFTDNDNELDREIMGEINSKNHMSLEDIKELVADYRNIKNDNEKVSKKLAEYFNSGIETLAN
jgi:hypothetical protein